MEAILVIMAVILGIVVIENVIVGILDLRMKSYMLGLIEEILQVGLPNSINLSEKERIAIAKIVREIMKEEGGE